MMYPLAGDLAAAGIPVVMTCRALGSSKQAFYAWKRSPVPRRDWDEAHLINAAMESFFALLQKNVLDRRRWDSRDQLRPAIITWIERTCHRRRRQRRPGKLTPLEYEMLFTEAALAA